MAFGSEVFLKRPGTKDDGKELYSHPGTGGTFSSTAAFFQGNVPSISSEQIARLDRAVEFMVKESRVQRQLRTEIRDLLAKNLFVPVLRWRL